MSDPLRWSEGGDASALERELLGAAQEQRLPEAERRALWASIALSLPAAPPLPPLAEAGTTSGTLGASLAKGALVASLVAGLGWSAALALRPSPRDVPTPTAVASVLAAPSALSPAPAPSVSASASAAPSGAVSPLPSPRPSGASQLREESAAVLEARAAFRAGDARRCLALLEQARSRFPRGALGQEREALAIEALARTGQRAAAQRRAAAFLRAHPQSPYVADLRRIAEN